MGPFRKADTFNTLLLFEVPYWASWGLFAEQTHSKRVSSSKFPAGHLGAFSRSRRIQNAFPLRSSLLGILGPFRRADTFKTFLLFEVPYWASWGLFAQQTQSTRFCSSKFAIGHLGAFSQSRHIHNAFPLRSSLLGILEPLRRADTFKTLFLFEVSLLGILGPFRKADAFKTLFLLEVPYWASWGLFRRADTFKTFLLFEVPYWASWGLFAKQTHSKSCCCSKFPIGHLGAFSQSKHINNVFLFEVPYWVSRGVFVKQTFKRFCSSKFPLGHLGALSRNRHIQNAFPPRSQSRHIQRAFLLRSSLLGILGLFGRANTFKALLLFEASYWASWGLCAKQTHSKGFSSSKFPIGYLGAFTLGRHIPNSFPLRSSLLGILERFRQANTFKRFSSSKFPIAHLGAFSQSRHIQNVFALRNSLLGILGPFRKADAFKTPFLLFYWEQKCLECVGSVKKASRCPIGNFEEEKHLACFECVCIAKRPQDAQ